MLTRALPTPAPPPLHLIICLQRLFPNKVTQVLETRTSTRRMEGHSSTHDRTKPESVHLPCKPTRDTATEKPGQAGHREGEGRSNVGARGPAGQGRAGWSSTSNLLMQRQEGWGPGLGAGRGLGWCLKGQGAACRSPRGVGANAGTGWDSGQLLAGPGEAKVLVIQPWEGWARRGCHPVLSTQVDKMETVGPLWKLGRSRQARPGHRHTGLGRGAGWVSAPLLPSLWPSLATCTASLGAAWATRAPWS